MTRGPQLLFVGVSLMMASLLVGAACSGRIESSEQRDAQQPQYTPTATIKDLMLSIVDPSADVVWESVTTVVGPNGIEEKVPQTEEEWTNVRRGAIRLIEATNLLQMPGRRVARPGEKSEAPGAELEPEEMDALINKDREGWNRRAMALHAASLEALQAIENKDSQKLMYDIGEQLERACENCHLQYWYPNQVLPPGYEETAR